MTPAERAVIDAARAFVEDDSLWNHNALSAAVRALPRPLSEQLAELRPGAVVEALLCDGHGSVHVLANLPERGAACVERLSLGEQPFVIRHKNITRVISNPEASDG